jgi:hypothetical protein
MIDEINLLNDQLMAFNIDKLTHDSHQKLERWRAYCHKLIDDIFEHMQTIRKNSNEGKLLKYNQQLLILFKNKKYQ